MKDSEKNCNDWGVLRGTHTEIHRKRSKETKQEVTNILTVRTKTKTKTTAKLHQKYVS